MRHTEKWDRPVRFEPVSPGHPHLLHGADYYPEQWLDEPEVLAADLRLMREAGIGVVSLGVFAWSALEPREGMYTFDWLDRVIDGLARAGIAVILATPSGSRPAWLSRACPEVLRTPADRRRELHGRRQNHCYTSPVYREKVRTIDLRLAERYGRHPALVLWHLSNEYGGECHCALCQEAFRAWLRCRYGDDLGRLNRAWYTAFWSHTFADWAEIESPAPHGETQLPALNLDWKRFVTDQTIDFMQAEIRALRVHSPDVPVTTNLMGTYPGLNYRRLAAHIDVASWDSYPRWHGTGGPLHGIGEWDPLGRDWKVAADTAFAHAAVRSLKGGRPFLIMESTPTFSNWHAVHKPKRPGMQRTSALLAVAHGSDSVQYFQWRQSPGGFEKMHGAVLDHAGRGDTRVFREVCEVGRTLRALPGVAGSTVPAQAALLFDWENRWALEDGSTMSPDGGPDYEATCKRHHAPLWELGVPVDVIGMDDGLSPYRLVVAPMLGMVRPGAAERLEAFVAEGGTLLATHTSGIVDANGTCFREGRPGPLRRLLGVRVEEADGLYPGESVPLVMRPGNLLGLGGEHAARAVCEVLQPEGAAALADYGGAFYRGTPALTVHAFGKGRAFYLACDVEDAFLAAFYRGLAALLPLERALPADLPEGVSAQVRTDGETDYVFVLNFTPERRTVPLGAGAFADALTGRAAPGELALEAYGSAVLARKATRARPTA